MVGRNAMDLGADEVIDAAIEILNERGLDAVSMRSVGARLGVSPQPLYSRVGNKEAMLAAMADRLMEGMAPEPETDEAWPDYATRWAYSLRSRMSQSSALGLVLGNPRTPFLQASRPFVETLQSQGFADDEAVQACRLVLWAVAGFSALQGSGAVRGRNRGGGRRRPGGDPAGVTPAEADHLFAMHIRYLIEGIERDR